MLGGQAFENDAGAQVRRPEHTLHALPVSPF